MIEPYTDHPDFNLPDEDESQTKLSQDFVDSFNAEYGEQIQGNDEDPFSDAGSWLKDSNETEFDEPTRTVSQVITKAEYYLSSTEKTALDKQAVDLAEDLQYQRLNVARGNKSDTRFKVHIADKLLNFMINNLCFELADAVEHTKASLYACQALKNIIKSEDADGLVNMVYLIRQYFLLDITDYLEDLGIATKGIVWWWVHQVLNTNPKNIWVDASQPPVHSDEADNELFLVKTENNNYTLKTYDFALESWGINIKAWMCISKPEFYTI